MTQTFLLVLAKGIRFISLSCLGLGFLASEVKASEAADAHFTLRSCETREISAAEAEQESLTTTIPQKGLSNSQSPNSSTVEQFSYLSSATSEPDRAGQLNTDKIVNIGKSIWKVVEAGEPKVTSTSDLASGLPQGSSSWEELDGWKAPKVKYFSVIYINKLNQEVVNLIYRISFIYGGQLHHKGQYIGQASVVPTRLKVAWGYKFDLEANIPSVYNMGKSNNPIAALNVNVKWTIHNLITHEERNSLYTLIGDGRFIELDPSP